MQHITDHNASTIKSTVKTTWFSYVGFIVSVSVTVLGIFVLATWAETSGWHHAAQHVLIFGSGIGLASSLLSIRKTKKEQE